jgi:hypothetical protein
MRVHMTMFLCWPAVLAIASPVSGQRVVQFTLHPAGEPVPAMKYVLLPELRDMKPGNAALEYLRAFSPEAFDNARRQPGYRKVGDWLELPLDQIPRAEARGCLPHLSLVRVDAGARSESCDWNMTEKMRQEGFFMPMDDFQSMREFANLVALRCRLDLADKRYDKAIDSLQTLLAMGRHVADGPTLMNALLGITIAQAGLDQVATLIQQPDAPNLYWALTDLPHPFVDLRRNLQGERVMMQGWFQELFNSLAHRQARPIAPEVILKKVELLVATSGGQRLSQMELAFAAARVHPKALSHLRSRGWTAEELDRLPVLQVAMMYALERYNEAIDQQFKWNNVPYWEGWPRMRHAEISRSEMHDPLSLQRYFAFAPALRTARQQQVALDRRISALRCLEAIRLHAASHHGRLPATLDEIQVPIPVDPMTGKAFAYRTDGDQAVLASPKLAGEPPDRAVSVRYEITMKSGTE